MKKLLLIIVAFSLSTCGMTVKYSLSGASIPPSARTFSVAYFPNNAPMVAPILSSELTNKLRDKFSNQTRLVQVDEGGDFAFEGEITTYSSTTSSVSGTSESALLNRLSITVRVRFTCEVQPELSFTSGGQSFTAFAEYDSSRMLNEVENELIPQIVDQLVTDIFQASAAQW